MLFLPDLTERRRLPEIMDQPDLEETSHLRALRGLARLNFWSGSVRILWPPIRDLARTTPRRPLRILDIATGAGDVPLGLWRKARRAGLSLDIAGCDLSPRAVAHARRQADEHGATLEFFTRNALTDDLPVDYDVLISSLFLHHLDEPEAVELLQRMSGAARTLVLVNDLVRGRAGLVLAQVATRMLTRSPVVHVDGPRSVAGAFTVAEARALAARAGLHGATVVKRWPFRFLLTWRRS